MDTEKVICTDSGCSAAEMAALLNNSNNNPAMMAMLGNNNWSNSPWMYLIFLALFGGNGFGFNRNGIDTATNFNSRQISELQSAVADNHNTDMIQQSLQHNSDLAQNALNGNRDAITQLAQVFNTDFGQMSQTLCNIKSAIESVAGTVGYTTESVKNAIALGDSNIIQAVQNTACTTQRSILFSRSETL